jgi:20S proteasome subunit beta 6
MYMCTWLRRSFLNVIVKYTQIGHKNQQDVPTTPLTLENALRITKDAFTSATERDIHTGDNLQIFVITKDGVDEQNYPLKKD